MDRSLSGAARVPRRYKACEVSDVRFYRRDGKEAPEEVPIFPPIDGTLPGRNSNIREDRAKPRGRVNILAGLMGKEVYMNWDTRSKKVVVLTSSEKKIDQSPYPRVLSLGPHRKN